MDNQTVLLMQENRVQELKVCKLPFVSCILSLLLFCLVFLFWFIQLFITKLVHTHW